MDNIITTERIDAYCLSLLADERSAGTLEKYRRDLTAFSRWLGGRIVTKETAADWKTHLLTASVSFVTMRPSSQRENAVRSRRYFSSVPAAFSSARSAAQYAAISACVMFVPILIPPEYWYP